MSLDPSAVRAAFGAHLEALSLTPALPIVSDNVGDDGENPRLETSLFPSLNARFGLGVAHQSTGFYQITVVQKSGIGAINADEVAQAVRDHFPVDSKFTAGDHVVRVTKTPDIAGGYSDDRSDWRVPVTVNYESWD